MWRRSRCELCKPPASSPAASAAPQPLAMAWPPSSWIGKQAHARGCLANALSRTAVWPPGVMAGDQVAPAPQFVRPLLVQLAQYAQGFAIISRTKLQPADQISTIVARLQCVAMHDSLLF